MRIRTLALAVALGMGMIPVSASAEDGQCFFKGWVCEGTFEECYRVVPIPCDLYEKPNAVQRLKGLILKWRNESQPSDSDRPDRTVTTGVRG